MSEVLIKDGSFRCGNTKFTLADSCRARLDNVVADPATGVRNPERAVVAPLGT
ncbi:hypothetical protein RAD15_40345 [Bradyrhizobium sp. 14AA]